MAGPISIGEPGMPILPLLAAYRAMAILALASAVLMLRPPAVRD
jgi:hypothetical protein